MCVCVWVCVCVCVCVLCVCVCVCVCVCMCVCVCVCCVCVYVCVCVCVCVCGCMCACVCACMHVCTCVHVYMCMYTHTIILCYLVRTSTSHNDVFCLPRSRPLDLQKEILQSFIVVNITSLPAVGRQVMVKTESLKKYNLIQPVPNVCPYVVSQLIATVATV